ncbi:Hypothetical protein R9X50_00084300 [Acrodontium crateriforme]|uniref:Uncharacterized protein n=1 Tax=Acrodontium crateriforme TaxID=150365 RepID=A0AAQ3LYA3_9PEZI|nr:Hypothetical protein R9X50_00084300 [Acrodontium crateriforme]
MALTVEKLNADSTFLLAFDPAFAPSSSSTAKPRRLPGAFTILIDPWLDGYSSVFHPSFQVSHHTASCAVNSLDQLVAPPDLVIISQEKPDHCHRTTLTSLPSHWPTTILAVPAAAKKIKSWNHFDPSAIQVLPTYSPDKPNSLVRIRLDPYTSTGSPGEITIAHVPTKRDVTGLHNAIGITYRPPGSLFTAIEGSIVHLNDIIHPTKSQPKKLRTTKSAFRLANVIRNHQSSDGSPTRPTTSDSKHVQSRSRSLSSPSSPHEIYIDSGKPPSPPLSRVDSKSNSVQGRTSPVRPPTASPPASLISPGSIPSYDSRTHLEPTLSVLYTPHGVSPSTLQPYIHHHLMPARALPLTALFHSMTTEANPWFMGGIVVNGAPGGVELVASLGGPGVKCWLSAHDEEKRHLGLATKFMRSKRWRVDEVQSLLSERFGIVDNIDFDKNKGSYFTEKDSQIPWRTDIRVLDVGERFRI